MFDIEVFEHFAFGVDYDDDVRFLTDAIQWFPRFRDQLL
jgi:hypothetical protein